MISVFYFTDNTLQKTIILLCDHTITVTDTNVTENHTITVTVTNVTETVISIATATNKHFKM